MSLPVLADGVVESRREVEDSGQRPLCCVRFLGLLEDQRGSAAALFVEAAETTDARGKADLVGCINDPAATAATAATFEPLKRKRIPRCFTAIAV